LADGRVYFGTDGDYLFALNSSSGEFLWQSTMRYGVRSSPAVFEDKVYVGSNDLNVYCLNGTTGAQLWNFKTNAWISCSPAVADGKVYVGEGMHAGPHDSVFFCLDASSGASVWNFTTQYNGAWISSSPAVVTATYMSSADGSSMFLDLTAPSGLPPEIKIVSPANQSSMRQCTSFSD
jgi:outer membrane protein assembly factor BamB